MTMDRKGTVVVSDCLKQDGLNDENDSVFIPSDDLLLRRMDPLHEDFGFTKTKDSVNSQLPFYQKTVDALNKKHIEDDNLIRKKLDSKSSEQSCPSVIVAKRDTTSVPGSCIKRRLERDIKTKCNPKSVPFPRDSIPSVFEGWNDLSTLGKVARRISKNGTVFTQSSNCETKPMVSIKQISQREGRRPAIQAKDDHCDNMDVEDKCSDPWLESLHRGLDRILFPGGCKL